MLPQRRRLPLIQIKAELRDHWLNASRHQAQPGDRQMREGLYDSSDYVARAGSLGPALAATADEIERNRELPASIVSALIDNGLFRLLQPRSLGGAELDPMTYFQVVEQIASLDASTGWCVEQANGCSMVAAFLDAEVARDIFETILRKLASGCTGSGPALPDWEVTNGRPPFQSLPSGLPPGCPEPMVADWPRSSYVRLLTR